MIDIKLIRENKELVKENIKKKFQDEKLALVDEIEKLDIEYRECKKRGDDLRALKNSKSSEIGALMREGKKEEANLVKEEVSKYGDEITELGKKEEELEKEIRTKMMNIHNIIYASVPIVKDDSENVEVERFGDPIVPDYEIPYHADVLEKLNGLDKEASGRTSGNGFYYLMGDIARLSTAMLNYARDYMIDKNFIYCIPPFMIHSSVVEGVMSFPEMNAMMYKSSPSILYIIAFISGKDITPSTTLECIINGGIQ